MARLIELPWTVKRAGFFGFIGRVLKEIIDDGVFTIAAAVAFYWLFAFFPFMIFLLSLLPLLPAEMKAQSQTQISSWIDASLPGAAGETIKENILNVFKAPSGGLISVGLILTLWAASNGINATMEALDRCYDILWRRSFLATRGVALLLTLGFVASVLTILILVPLGNLALGILEHPEIKRHLPAWLGGPWRMTLDITRYLIGGMLLVFILSAIYQFGTSVRRRWSLITPGAIVCVGFIAAAAWGFGVYINHFGGEGSYVRTYGAVGGVVILLLLFYYYAVAFLIGAEINSEIDLLVAGINPDRDGKIGLRQDTPELRRFRERLISRRSPRVKRQRNARGAPAIGPATGEAPPPANATQPASTEPGQKEI